MKLLIFTVITGMASFFTNAPDFENTPDGKTVFKNACASCHAGGFKGFMSGAPEIGETEDWVAFFEKGETAMVKNVFEGTKRHEAKGGCDDCTKEDVQAAIKYILNQTK